jgi:hypothetical protein
MQFKLISTATTVAWTDYQNKIHWIDNKSKNTDPKS